MNQPTPNLGKTTGILHQVLLGGKVGVEVEEIRSFCFLVFEKED